MKTTYHSNPGISDSSQVGNASSKEEMGFEILVMYPHVGFSSTNWLGETFEVCEYETWSLGLHLLLPDSRAVGRMFWSISLFSTLCILGTVISSVCHKAGRELALCCTRDTLVK